MNLPNKLTIARVIAVPIFIACYMLGLYILAFVIFILAAITDLLDGNIARKHNLVSNFGKIMDPLADKVLVYSAICLFVADGTVPAWTFIVILAREFLVAGIRTVAASNGIVIAADLSGKIKTVLQMIAVPALILYHGLLGNEAELVKHSFTWWIYIIACLFYYASVVMTVYSGAEYLLKNKEVFSNE